MFGAAAGKYIVFSDGDVAFRPGWLSASLKLFESFPKRRHGDCPSTAHTDGVFSATLDWAKQAGVLEEGQFPGLGNFLGACRKPGPG